MSVYLPPSSPDSSPTRDQCYSYPVSPNEILQVGRRMAIPPHILPISCEFRDDSQLNFFSRELTPPIKKLSPEEITSKYLQILKEKKDVGFIDAFLRDGHFISCELHSHLGGNIPIEKIIRKAIECNWYYNPDEKIFLKDFADGCVKASELRDNKRMYNDLMNEGSMQGAGKSDQHSQYHFFDVIWKTIESALVLMDFNEIMHIIVEPAYKDGTRILELKTEFNEPTIVSEVAQKAFEGMSKGESFLIEEEKIKELYHNKEVQKLTTDTVNRIIGKLDRFDNYLADTEWKVEGQSTRVKWKDIPVTERVTVLYHGQVDRNMKVNQFFMSMLVYMTLIHTDPKKRVVAVDIAGKEFDYNANNNFKAQLKIMRILEKLIAPTNMSIHAGEYTENLYQGNLTKNRITQTLKYACGFKGKNEPQPQPLKKRVRIGHGTAISQEKNVSNLVKLLRDNDILIEVCLTSNEKILGLKSEELHLNFLKDRKVPFALCTDDADALRTNSLKEKRKAIMEQKLTYQAFKQIDYASFHYSFCPGESIFERDKEKGELILRQEFAELPNNEISEEGEKIIDNSLKAALQLKLYRQYAEFEKTIAKEHKDEVEVEERKKMEEAVMKTYFQQQNNIILQYIASASLVPVGRVKYNSYPLMTPPKKTWSQSYLNDGYYTPPLPQKPSSL